MINYNELTMEQRLLLLTSRITISFEEIDMIKDILSSNTINWFEFFKYALYHKTATLCWSNIKKIKPDVNIPKYLNFTLIYIYNCIKNSNILYENEIKVLINEMSKEGITILPVKGLSIINEIYKDYGLRFSGDADFLIKHDDTKKLNPILNKLDYFQGDYDSSTNTINKISRLEVIKWKLISTLYPYIKIINNDILTYCDIDFRYALDDSLNKEPINEIIDNYIETGIAEPSHKLLHLCTHFFDEAKHSIDIFYAKDLNIIKLCDIREYILKHKVHGILENCVDLSIKYNLQKQVYFTMFYLELIYNDGYETETILKMGIKENSFLKTFGESTLKDNYMFKNDVIERLFSCNNADELQDIPSLLKN